MTRPGKRSGNGSPGGPGDRFRRTWCLFLGTGLIVYQAVISQTDRKELYAVAFILMGFADERTIARIIRFLLTLFLKDEE